MKKIIALVLAAACCLSLFGCSTVKPEDVTLNVAVIKGPTGIGAIHLMDDNSRDETDVNYKFTVLSSPEEAVAKITSKECDIAAVPTNLASTLYNKTSGKIRVLALNTYGVLYILDSTGTVNSVEDLKGKTVYSTGQGANPEYILNYVLKGNNIDPKTDLTVKFVGTNDELAPLLIKGEAEVALVPEPLVSTVMAKNKNLKNVINMTEEWNALGTDSLVMGCVIARDEVVENYPNTVAAFLKEYEASIKSCKNVEKTATLCENYGIIASKAIAEAAIPNCNLTYIDGQKMKTTLSDYLNVLSTFNPKAIGGALPGDDFYYSK